MPTPEIPGEFLTDEDDDDQLREEWNQVLESGDLVAIEQYFSTHEHYLRKRVTDLSLSTSLDKGMFTAAYNNDLKALELLARLGANMHVYGRVWMQRGYYCNPEGLIEVMFLDGDDKLPAAKWLLAHGAVINHEKNGQLVSNTLFSAAMSGALEGVKLLLEHGAAIDGLASNGMSTLDLALMERRTEVADYLRSKGARHGWQVRGESPPDPSQPPKHPGTMRGYLTKYLGPVDELSLQEIIPTGIPLSILRIQANEQLVLATEGMSAQPIPGPVRPAFEELIVRLKDNWPLEGESLDDPRYRWPIDWLRKVARWPHENQTWLGTGMVFANGDPPEPIAPDTAQSSVLVVPAGHHLMPWRRPDGEEVIFYLLYPIYAEEAAFEKAQGTKALLERFRDRDAPMHFDPHRKNLGLRDMYDVDDDDSASSAP